MKQTNSQERQGFTLFSNSTCKPVVKDITEDILSGNPTQRVWLEKEDSESGLKFGTWDCQAGSFKVEMNGIFEFCHILEGQAEIKVLSSDRIFAVRAGDAFVMEPGLALEWTVPEYIRKHFVISETKESLLNRYIGP